MPARQQGHQNWFTQFTRTDLNIFIFYLELKVNFIFDK